MSGAALPVAGDPLVRELRSSTSAACMRAPRPSSCSSPAADVTVTRANETVGGTSIMGLMMLAASPGCAIRVTAKGREAREVIAALEELIAARFGEEV